MKNIPHDKEVESLVEEFRRRFCTRENGAIGGFALLLLKADVQSLETFLRAALTRIRTLTLEEVEGLANEYALDEAAATLEMLSAPVAAKAITEFLNRIRELKNT